MAAVLRRGLAHCSRVLLGRRCAATTRLLSSSPHSGAARMDGATLLAHSLAAQGVTNIFGIVGVPVIPIAFAAQHAGIKFYGMRNEQSASYAANAYGYLKAHPGVCLVVSGPGVIHALSGLSNAQANNWPMVLIGGASPAAQDGRGAFQECLQVEAARMYCKAAMRADAVERIPFLVERAFRLAAAGRPGAVYLDLPDNVITAKVEATAVSVPPLVPALPPCPAPPAQVAQALDVLAAAQRPLVIIGKGAAYARAEDGLRALVDATGLPFLPTPMGKGVVSDEHEQCVAAARSTALKSADVVLLVGARLNWILHFGMAPRFAKDVKIIQVDSCPEEFHGNVRTLVPLQGDAGVVVQQLLEEQRRRSWRFQGPAWWSELRSKGAANKKVVDAMAADRAVPMNYYSALSIVEKHIPRHAIVVSEGSNTMDIGRSVLQNEMPRRRLDAGTFGTMGVGMGFAFAAAVTHPGVPVFAVVGDSAFGFSGMEIETMYRHGLPIVVVVINNNGIYQGASSLEIARASPLGLLPDARYDKMAEAFGGDGYWVRTPEELEAAMIQAARATRPTIVNVMVSPTGERKAQEFPWLTSA